MCLLVTRELPKVRGAQLTTAMGGVRETITTCAAAVERVNNEHCHKRNTEYEVVPPHLWVRYDDAVECVQPPSPARIAERGRDRLAHARRWRRRHALQKWLQPWRALPRPAAVRHGLPPLWQSFEDLVSAADEK